MTLTMSPNNKARKSLANEIDRLDRTLDGLADGLNEAVADAVKSAVGAAVKEAVQSVLMEVLTNADVLARLHASTSEPMQPAPKKPDVWDRVSQLWQNVCMCLASVRLMCSQQGRKLSTRIGKGWHAGVERLAHMWDACQVVRHFKYHILLALGIGIVTGIGVWQAEPWLGVVASGIGGFMTTLTVQGGLWLRRMFAGEGEQYA